MKENNENKKFGQMHLHTPKSDGLNTTQDIIDAKLDFVCITDHDSIDSIAEYSRVLKPRGIDVISNCAELTTIHMNKRIHVLVYGVNSTPEFLNALNKSRNYRKERAYGMVDKLVTNGLLADNRFIENASGTITEGHIALEVLSHAANLGRLKREGIDGVVQFMKAYLKRGKPGFVPMERIELSDYLQTINGCAKILAHPGEDLNMGEDDYIIENLVNDFGFAGIETNTRKHTPIQKEYYQQLADKLGIIGMTSNDCHIKTQLYENKANNATLERLLGKEILV